MEIQKFESDKPYGSIDFYVEYFKFRIPDLSELDAFKLALEYMKVTVLRSIADRT